MTPKQSTLAVSYARALLELADERGITEPIAQDVAGLKQLLEENPAFGQYLADPGVQQEERTNMLRTTFAGKAEPLTMHFLEMLTAKGRLGILRDISESFEALLDERLGKVEVDVTVAKRLEADELEMVRGRLAGIVGKDVVIHQYVDETIIGGMIVRFGDQILDASVQAQLEAMRRKLLRAK
ncbi:MAG: ATP synthase F1 subunit delta [Phycisphaerae bacterium]